LVLQYAPEKTGWEYQIRRYATLYWLWQLRQFRDWNEDLYYEEGHIDGDPDELSDDDYVYVQDNYTVTKSCFANKSR
jgi:hypothetical protein